MFIKHLTLESELASPRLPLTFKPQINRIINDNLHRVNIKYPHLMPSIKFASLSRLKLVSLFEHNEKQKCINVFPHWPTHTHTRSCHTHVWIWPYITYLCCDRSYREGSMSPADDPIICRIHHQGQCTSATSRCFNINNGWVWRYIDAKWYQDMRTGFSNVALLKLGDFFKHHEDEQSKLSIEFTYAAMCVNRLLTTTTKTADEGKLAK